MKRCEQNSTVPPLGQAVSGAVNHIDPHRVAERSKRGLEVAKHGVSTNRRNILHRHDVWKQLSHQTREMVEKTPAVIALDPLILLIAQRISREWLTWCTSRKNSDGGVLEPLLNAASAEARYIDAMKSHAIVVYFIRVPTSLLEVDPDANVDPGAAKPMSQPTCTTEEVYARDITSSLVALALFRSMCRQPHEFLTRLSYHSDSLCLPRGGCIPTAPHRRSEPRPSTHATRYAVSALSACQAAPGVPPPTNETIESSKQRAAPLAGNAELPPRPQKLQREAYLGRRVIVNGRLPIRDRGPLAAGMSLSIRRPAVLTIALSCPCP
jgi:hypothetical protein